MHRQGRGTLLAGVLSDALPSELSTGMLSGVLDSSRVSPSELLLAEVFRAFWLRVDSLAIALAADFLYAAALLTLACS